MVEKLHQHKHIHRDEERIMTDIWDGMIWRKFMCTRQPNNPLFMSLEGSLGFTIYIDCFNAHEKSRRLSSIGPILLVCLNLPTSKRLNPENVYISAIIPGPNDPTSSQLNYLLMPLMPELKELWEEVQFFLTSSGPSGSFIRVAILTAMRKFTGFISHS
ncbi:hypothetical protein O181_044607 [Austropuccinia psidii MF-1]|uniref:Uncharacterized protein n=1 Tax=Austropuccinia psidii MF-1 TaxID=1389203 RepID=A0A9Q3DMS0_9BASI|nr:hypothetical protein [Austropuccinia psidii MF-1]